MIAAEGLGRGQANPGAMENSSAQRRLVKSPPELWAEVSSEDALARHLAQFGEIRITRLEPETTVAWEGERASGTVELEPAGWGTKVTLTATPARAEPVVAEPAAAATPPFPAAPPAPRPGFLARLLQRRPKHPPEPGPPAPGSEPPPPAPDPAPTSGDASEILSEVLDDLGAHHRRPFSRD